MPVLQTLSKKDRAACRNWKRQVGKRLFEARLRRNWTTRKLARKSGISRDRIDLIELGRGRTWLDDLFHLSRVLDLPPPNW